MSIAYINTGTVFNTVSEKGLIAITNSDDNGDFIAVGERCEMPTVNVKDVIDVVADMKKEFNYALAQAARYGEQIFYLLCHKDNLQAIKVQDSADNFINQFSGRTKAILRREIDISAYSWETS